jgi:hypothetical protein
VIFSSGGLVALTVLNFELYKNDNISRNSYDHGWSRVQLSGTRSFAVNRIFVFKHLMEMVRKCVTYPQP